MLTVRLETIDVPAAVTVTVTVCAPAGMELKSPPSGAHPPMNRALVAKARIRLRWRRARLALRRASSGSSIARTAPPIPGAEGVDRLAGGFEVLTLTGTLTG